VDAATIDWSNWGVISPILAARGRGFYNFCGSMIFFLAISCNLRILKTVAKFCLLDIDFLCDMSLGMNKAHEGQ
jgi:hypothetical protein